jgi:hypothetical protein
MTAPGPNPAPLSARGPLLLGAAALVLLLGGLGLKPRDAPGRTRGSRAPQRPGRMHIERAGPRREGLIDRSDVEYAALAVEVRDITRFEHRPAAIHDPPCEHGIEHEAARRRQPETAVGAEVPRGNAPKVGQPVAEALWTEVIGRAARCEIRKARNERLTIARDLAQPQFEAVSRQSAARQLALVSMRLEHAVAFARNAAPLVGRALAARHGVPLGRDGMTILEPGVADIERPATRATRKFTRHPFRVRAPLADTQQQMCALARWCETELLIDEEVFRLSPQTAACRRRAESPWRVERERAPAVRHDSTHRATGRFTRGMQVRSAGATRPPALPDLRRGQ